LAREVLEGGRVKGSVLRSHLLWAAEHQPPLKIQDICQHVSPESVRVLQAPILTLGWYPFRTVIETDRAISALAGGVDLKESVIALGRYSARINLTTNYRVTPTRLMMFDRLSRQCRRCRQHREHLVGVLRGDRSDQLQ